MKKRRVIAGLLLVFSIMAPATGGRLVQAEADNVSSENTVEQQPVTSTQGAITGDTMWMEKLTLFAGTSQRLSEQGGVQIRWQSEKPAIASVDELGIVTGMKVGKTKVTADCNGTIVTREVVVKKNVYKAKKLTKKQVGYDIKLRTYCAEYKNDKLQCKVMIVNNTGMKIKKVDSVTIEILGEDTETMASYKSKQNFSMEPFSIKSIKITIPKSKIKTMGNLKKATINTTGHCKSSWK